MNGGPTLSRNSTRAGDSSSTSWKSVSCPKVSSGSPAPGLGGAGAELRRAARRRRRAPARAGCPRRGRRSSCSTVEEAPAAKATPVAASRRRSAAASGPPGEPSAHAPDSRRGGRAARRLPVRQAVSDLGGVDDLERLVDRGQLEHALHGGGAAHEHEPAAGLHRPAARGHQAGEPAGVEEGQLAQVEADAARVERLDALELLVERVRVLEIQLAAERDLDGVVLQLLDGEGQAPHCDPLPVVLVLTLPPRRANNLLAHRGVTADEEAAGRPSGGAPSRGGAWRRSASRPRWRSSSASRSAAATADPTAARRPRRRPRPRPEAEARKVSEGLPLAQQVGRLVVLRFAGTSAPGVRAPGARRGPRGRRDPVPRQPHRRPTRRRRWPAA